MKNLVSGIAIALLLGAIYSTPIQAQTYDGVTPAEETVCGELLADGVTKGLYGLCVAYCEAQDGLSYEEVGSNWATYEYDTDDTLLQVYNKRKKETDPPMPCAVPLPTECPCFDQAFVDKIDGYNDLDGQPANRQCAPSSFYRSITAQEWSGFPSYLRRRVSVNERSSDSTGYQDPNSRGTCTGSYGIDRGDKFYYRHIEIYETELIACRQIASTAPVCSGG